MDSWGDEKPTTGGYYWSRNKAGEVRPVAVAAEPGEPLRMILVGVDAMVALDTPEMFDGWAWAPLGQPKASAPWAKGPPHEHGWYFSRVDQWHDPRLAQLAYGCVRVSGSEAFSSVTEPRYAEWEWLGPLQPPQ